MPTSQPAHKKMHMQRRNDLVYKATQWLASAVSRGMSFTKQVYAHACCSLRPAGRYPIAYNYTYWLVNPCSRHHNANHTSLNIPTPHLAQDPVWRLLTSTQNATDSAY